MLGQCWRGKQGAVQGPQASTRLESCSVDVPLYQRMQCLGEYFILDFILAALSLNTYYGTGLMVIERSVVIEYGKVKGVKLVFVEGL